MPSTRKQKAKSRKSREMDILFEYDNMDVMLGRDNFNSIERELDEMTPEGHQDTQSLPNRGSSSQVNEMRVIENRYGSVRQERVSESFKILSDEMNARFSREMDSMMDLMQSEINRAISSDINDRVIPEIQSLIGKFLWIVMALSHVRS